MSNLQDQLNKLQALVEQLELNKISFEEGLSLYKQGIQLSQNCSKNLAQAQQEIDNLQQIARQHLEIQNLDSELKKSTNEFLT